MSHVCASEHTCVLFCAGKLKWKQRLELCFYLQERQDDVRNGNETSGGIVSRFLRESERERERGRERERESGN
jgi:hypothetical protein